MKSRLLRFVGELKRRHVFRAVAGYAVVAFVVLQAGEIILPAFEAPAWVLQLVVVLAAMGFPIVLVVAWVYALTPRGLERTTDLDQESGVARGEPSVLPQIALAVATVVVLGSAGLWFVRQPAVDAAQTVQPVAESVRTVDDPDMRITSIAVLPLNDFSPDGGQDYFAASMHEEIVAQLSKVSSLRVVSRTSVAQYAGTEKLIPDIGAELGVQGIVEGSVTRAEGKVRITVQLIHAPTDTHLWANSYEREMKDIFALQAEVAGEVAKAIQGEVEGTAEPERLVAAPVNPEAMDAYMRAHFEQEAGTPESLEAAEAHFSRAITIDSAFVPAMVGLAGTRFLLAIQGDSLSPERLMAARRTAEAALEIDAESDEARAVLMAVDERLAEPGDRAGGVQVSVRMEAPVDSLEREYLRRFTDFGRMARDVMIVHGPDGAADSKAWSLGAAQSMMSDGEYAGASAVLEALIQEDPKFVNGWDALERIYATQGDLANVVETRKRRLAEFGGDQAYVAEQVAALDAAVAAGGLEGYWEWLLVDHRARQERGEYASEVEYAAACVALGDYEDALDALEAGLEKRERALVTLRSDPVWDPLRQNPRFRQIQAAVRAARRPPPPPGEPFEEVRSDRRSPGTPGRP